MRYLVIVSWLFIAFSCKKNSENLLERNLSESIQWISSDLNTLVFSQSLVDKFCTQEFYDQADCFDVESDTVSGVVTHTIHFQKDNFCDFYSDSTDGTIQVRFAINYGDILDTVTVKYIDFKSNGHVFNGELKAIYLSNVNFTTSVQKIILSNLAVAHKGTTYYLNGEFSSFLAQQKFKTSGFLMSSLFGEDVQLQIVNSLEHEGNYSWTQPYHTPFFLGGVANIFVGTQQFETHYGVNSSSYLDYSKAVCIDSTGYRYILEMNKW